MKWYIVYTKPDSEKKVSEILTRRKIENYSPVNSVVKDWDDRKVKESQLFIGYVFVKTTEQQLQDLKKIHGIVNIVHWMGNPVSVKSVEIKAIKLFLNEYNNVSIEKTAIKPHAGNTANHPGMEQEAPMITIKNRKAYVGLPSLGYIMTAHVDTSNVRIISADSPSNQENLKPNKFLNRFSEINNSLKNYWVKAFALSICVLLVTK